MQTQTDECQFIKTAENLMTKSLGNNDQNGSGSGKRDRGERESNLRWGSGDSSVALFACIAISNPIVSASQRELSLFLS